MSNQKGQGNGGRRRNRKSRYLKALCFACPWSSLNLVLSHILPKLKEKVRLMVEKWPKKGIWTIPGRLPPLCRLYSVHREGITHLPLVGSIPCFIKCSPHGEQGEKLVMSPWHSKCREGPDSLFPATIIILLFYPVAFSCKMHTKSMFRKQRSDYTSVTISKTFLSLLHSPPTLLFHETWLCFHRRKQELSPLLFHLPFLCK